MKTLNDLFMHFLQDVYYAERQLLKALPKMAQSAQEPSLKEAFTTHREETVHQIERLEQVFEHMGRRAKQYPARPSRALSKRPRTSSATASPARFATPVWWPAGRPSSTMRWRATVP